MSVKGEKAKELFEQGYNCSQAVFAAFCEETGLSFNNALLISGGFGGGVGRMREVCGAVSGMTLTASVLYGFTDAKARAEKAEIYKKVQALANAFKEKNGSIVCRELLGLSKDADITHIPDRRSNGYYKKRPCAELVQEAAEILEEFIKQNPAQSKYEP